MKPNTLRHFTQQFLTTEEQAHYAGVTTGTYKNAPQNKVYNRRVLIQLIKDLEHETAASDGADKEYYRAAAQRAKAFLSELRNTPRHSTG